MRNLSRASVDVLLADLERAAAWGQNPAASRLWMHAGPELRRQFGHGLIDEATFWLRLRRWLAFRQAAVRDAA
jgi:hypothetical protein